MADSPAFMDESDNERTVYSSSDKQQFREVSSKNGKNGAYSKMIVQEVSMTYTGMRGASPPPPKMSHMSHTVDVSRPIQVETNLVLPSVSPRSRSNTHGSLRDFLSSYDRRVSESETVDRISHSGRHETEFPVRIAYTGSAPLSPPVYSVPITSDSRATTTRLGSSLGSLITETTEQHYHAFSTRRSEMAASPTSVNALAAQFERTAREQRQEAIRSTTPKKSPTQVVVVKPSPVFKSSSYGSDSERSMDDQNRVRRVERQVYSPTDERSIISTTIVDIEPPNYGRRSTTPQYIQETYQVQEEYHTIKTYSPTKPGTVTERVHVREGSRDSAVREHIREDVHISRSTSSNDNRAITPVKTVVEKFESHMEDSSRGRKSPMVDTIRQEIIMQSRKTHTSREEEESTRIEHQRREEERIREERRREEERRRDEERRRHEEIRIQEERRQQTIIEERTIEELRIRRRKEDEKVKQEEEERRKHEEKRKQDERRRHEETQREEERRRHEEKQREEERRRQAEKHREEERRRQEEHREVERLKHEEEQREKEKKRMEAIRIEEERRHQMIIEERTIEELRIKRRREADIKKKQEEERLQRDKEEMERQKKEEERRREEQRIREERIRIQDERRYHEEVTITEERRRIEREETQRKEATEREKKIKEEDATKKQKEEEQRKKEADLERERQLVEQLERENRRIEEDKIRLAEERERKRKEEEAEKERHRLEEIRRENEKAEEERQRKEEDSRKEAERKRLEERRRQEQLKIEEEQRREELRIIERRRIEEERHEKEERRRRMEEEKREEERERDRQRELERRRQEEIRIQEERTKWEDRRRIEERRREEERIREEDRKKQQEMEKPKEKVSSEVKKLTTTTDTVVTTKEPYTSTADIVLDSRMTEDYRSGISTRPGFTRGNMNAFNSSSSTTSYGGASGNRVLKIVNEVSSSTLSGLSPFGQHAASSIRDSREREKKEMSDLNDRLASYIEKVRFLEAQNRKLGTDLDLLRSRWGKDTSSIRTMYESELTEARKLIAETNRQRDDLEKEIRRLMDELAEYRRKYETALHTREADRQKIDDLLQTLSALEAEIALLKRRISNIEDEVTRVKKDNQRLMGELQRARQDLDQETLNRIDYQNQVQTLLEEIDFIRRVNDQEIRDLQAMASRDTTSENREYFKNELSSAIRDIRQEYDQISSVNKNDMESWYKLKVQEIQTQSARTSMEQGYAKEEVKRLRTQLGDLRGKLTDLEGRNSLLEKQVQELNYQLEDDQRSYESALNDRDAQIRKMREECQALMVELQMLLDTKQTLDAEIAIYRKMLEGEENRAGLRQLVEQVVKTTGISHVEENESMRVLKGEQSSRTSFQRSAKGNVSIQEASVDGKFIVLENTHRSREEDIGGWKLKRKIDGKKEIVYTFPTDFILRPQKTIKIIARGQGMQGPDVLMHESDDSFGTGSNVQTILFNLAGEERATHIQRSSRD